MDIDHVHFYVEDAQYWKNWFVDVMGFQSLGKGKNSHTQTEIVTTGYRDKPIVIIFSSPLSRDSPVYQFLQIHPAGVRDVAFRVQNLEQILSEIPSIFKVKVAQIQQKKYLQGGLKWSKIINPNNLFHTLVERQGNTPVIPDDWIQQTEVILPDVSNFLTWDHLVFNVGKNQLESTVKWYQNILGFEKKQAFIIETPQSGLYSQVMFHPLSGIQFPINEPLSSNSQIQEFLDVNNGAGIQHIALRTKNIIEVTKKLDDQGMKFLKVPQTYYENLLEKGLKLNVDKQEWQKIVRQHILLDQEYNYNREDISDNYPLLLQIFSEPMFDKPTFFWEIIERRKQATGFGEGNFRALFEAIEREQMKRGSLVN
ncbi:MAG: 4-hydroxyphenylpyruvate dioxygenase [Crocosphaera sp.]|nr:4-hydroxyphenylpyruvate dioxygenase [Crocosphaera sp.]